MVWKIQFRFYYLKFNKVLIVINKIFILMYQIALKRGINVPKRILY